MPFHPGIPVSSAETSAYARRQVFEAPQGALQTSGGLLKSDLYRKKDGSIGSKAKRKSSKGQLVKYPRGTFKKGVFSEITSEMAMKALKKKK